MYRVRDQSDGAGVTERARQQRTVRVEDVGQIMGGRFAFSAAIVEAPSLRRGEFARVTLAEFTSACRVLARDVEPDRHLLDVESERRSRRCVAARSRTASRHDETVAPTACAFVSPCPRCTAVGRYGYPRR